MKKLTILTTVSLVLMLVFVAGVQVEAEDELTVAVGMDVEQLDPAFISDIPSERVASQVHDRLLRLDAEGNIQPNLAADWEVSEDASVWTFHLKDDVQFTDGSHFDAEIVKWHFDRLKDPELGSDYQDQFSIIEELNIIDDYTVEFVLERSYGPFINTIIFSPGGLIPSREHLEAIGADDYSSNPVGTGPFVFENWDPGSSIDLVKNENYHRKDVSLDRLIFRPISEPMTRLVELRTGGVDVVQSIPFQDVEDLVEDPNVDMYTEASDFYVNFLWFNLEDDSIFQDNPALREAIALSINKMEIAQAIHGDYAIRNEGYVPKSSWAYPEETNPVPFDLDKAREVLEEAGYYYEDELLYKDGEQVTLEYLGTTSEEQWELIAQIVIERLRQLGIETDLTMLEWGAYLDRFTSGDFTLSSMGWSQSVDEPALYLDVLVMTDGRGNFTGYSNEEVDELLTEAAALSSREARMELYNQVYDILEADLPMVPILSQPLLEGVNANVNNYIYSPFTNDYTDITIDR